MTPIYAIEGHAFAGKTTLVKYLAKIHEFNCVGEYDSYVSTTESYPPHPHKTAAIAKLDVDFFTDLDLKREADLKEHLFLNRPIIMDRTFLSLILFQKYTKHLNRKNEYNSYDYAKKKYLALINSGVLSIPDFMIYLTSENIATHNSRLARKISSELLRSIEAYHFFNQQYSEIFQVYKNADRLLVLSSNNTQKNLKENALRIKNATTKPVSIVERSNIVKGIFETI